MRARAVLALALLALSLCDLPANAQVSLLSNPSIGLGFGPTSLRPIGDGVPIYTVGDQMWISSYSQSSLVLNLTDPSGVLVAQQFVGPNSSSLFYSFSSSDPAGVWTLDTALAFVPQNAQVTQILLAKPSPSTTTMTGYKLLGNGQLSMNFTIASSTAYDIGACLVGSGLPDTASVPIPSKQGVGQLVLGRSGREVSVSLEGQVTNPFTFWLELHQDYSYLLQGTSTVVSRDVLAAESNAVAVQIGRPNLTKTVFQSDLRMRTGRYTLRAFFEGSGGLSAYETSVLLTNSGSWIWLQGCTAASSSLTSSFALASSLTRPISQWPREVYTMYKDEGIDTFSLESLDVMPAAVAVFASPWDAALTSAHPSLIPNTNVDGFAFVNNTIYLTAKQYPATFVVSLLGGGSKETYSVQVGPFSVNVLNISTTKVVVSALQDGKPLSGVSVTLKYNNETLATLSTKAGKAIFYVPAADYTVGASFGNSTMVGSVAGRAGIEADVTFDFGGSPSQVISYLLIVTGISGLLASLWLWVRIYRRRALRLDRGRAFRQNADSPS